MAETKQYRVLRDHIGGDGTLYSPAGANSTREALPHEVAHLVPQTLVEIDAAAEAAKAPENKADKPVKEVKGA